MDISYVLQIKYAGKEYALYGNEYANLEWLDASDKPSLEDLEKAYLEIQDEQETEKANLAANKVELEAKKQEVLAKLGLTADEAVALLS
jgi:hypothetical protein